METIRVGQLSIGVRGRIYYPTYTLWLGDSSCESEFKVETPFKYESTRHEKEFVLYEEGRANMEALVMLIEENLPSCLVHPNIRIRQIAQSITNLGATDGRVRVE